METHQHLKKVLAKHLCLPIRTDKKQKQKNTSSRPEVVTERELQLGFGATDGSPPCGNETSASAEVGIMVRSGQQRTKYLDGVANADRSMIGGVHGIN